MARENAADKARRYLTEGRVTVRRCDHDQAVAIVRGDGELYRAEWTRSTGWTCTCPARTDRCSHLTALRLVTVANPEVSP